MDRFKLIPELRLLLIRNKDELVLGRFNTGYEDSNYSLVAGHIDGDEPASLELCHITHRRATDERMSLFFKCTVWVGVPKNVEPTIYDNLCWFAIDDLPSNTIPYTSQAIAESTKSVCSEFVGS